MIQQMMWVGDKPLDQCDICLDTDIWEDWQLVNGHMTLCNDCTPANCWHWFTQMESVDHILGVIA